ncbi:class II 3-deoxy-7-phosphoheptulonate synthase [Streptomyces liangshanensis]|uniref:Phospho-2-dehydro-3-deoxyheptonate aldolase n=1 Tax=Streptomyces liangshanensis TaxID=2717324 RepID=A0A6G9H2C6_9ACTN|nr:3-deoxy-7-phosphoheptulonate synthase class II [Streptomyces liangshanensis]QIQ04371.1 3-deoxy-7-phosphoheptulonate synthase class II [Streptomyces liangshanensis]
MVRDGEGRGLPLPGESDGPVLSGEAGGPVPPRESDGRVTLPAAQQPDWPDPAGVEAVRAELRGALPLVIPGECDLLTSRIAAVARGEAFLLQGGDCAETFAGVQADPVRAKVRTLLQMALVLTYAAAVPVVKVGRMAGQYAKPRSEATETRDGLTLPAYRGDAVNDVAFTPEARALDPRRLLRTHQAAAATLNLIRAFTTGGYADLRQAHAWNQDFVARSPVGDRYAELAIQIDQALNFMRACGIDEPVQHAVEFFVSHEGLLLDYEEPLVREDPLTGRMYSSSGHMLWIGERTRQLDGAHVEFFSRIANPIAVKLGPGTSADTVLSLIDRLDPQREPGRLTFVVRMGSELVRDRLPPLVEKAAGHGAAVTWVCDPMHGNTFKAPSGHKTRSFDAIADEVKGFFEVHHDLGTHPGGLHLEFTGGDVTECVGGGTDVLLEDLADRYESACDPRLNRTQSLDLAFLVAGMYSPG